MYNELTVGRRIALSVGHPIPHDDGRHQPGDWKAFLKALDRASAFERRPGA